MMAGMGVTMQNRQIDRLINQLVKKSAHSKDKALFIRHYDAYSIDAGCVKKIVEDAGFFCLDHEFSLYGIQSAFEPFLDWTKELYPKSGEGSIRDFLKKCRVYPLHYGILESFIETGACVRWEDILLHEISYEQTRMMKNIINIFQYMSENKNHAHNKLLSFKQIRKLLHVIRQVWPDFVVFIVCPEYVNIAFLQAGYQLVQKAQRRALRQVDTV